MPNLLRNEIFRLYPAFEQLPHGLRSALLERLQLLTVPAGTRVFDAGTPCQGFPLVLKGGIRVARGTADGKALELYRVVPGDICIVSAGCLFNGAPLSAYGESYADTEFTLLSRDDLIAATDEPAMRNFVFGIFAERLADLSELVEAVAFHRVDRRLAELLLGHGREVRTSHQDLAARLGTSREIVSRLIARFARSGWVTSGRENIQILDPGALRAVAAGSAESAV